MLICEKMDLVTMWNRVQYFITDCSTSCMSVLLSATQFTMILQFPITQNVLFHIVTHLDFCHTMAASAPAVSGGNRR